MVLFHIYQYLTINMKFSVLIPIYNMESPLFFREALHSIWQDQTLKPDEIVIVKDGPLTNELDHVVKEFSEIAPVKIVALKSNVGIGKALNQGVIQCSYDYIARMDSDDIAFPNRFEKQISYLEQHPEIGILSSWIDEFIDNKHNVISTRKVPKKHVEIIKKLKGRCPINHPTVVFKKEAVITSGNYKPFFLKEDAYLWLRLYINNVVFANIDESLLFFRITKDTYRRRGGLKYAISEYKILKYRYTIGFINIFELSWYLLITIPIRLAPPSVRAFIYTRFLR
jgi:glycosyltransferase involved in cell wall biosynthesis